MAIRVGKGKSAVVITGFDAAEIERDLRDALGPVFDEIEKKAAVIMATIREDWPVKSGESRDAWETVPNVMPGEMVVEMSFVNPLPYVPYIQSTREGTDEKGSRRVYRPLTDIVRKPAAQAKKELRASLPAILSKHILTRAGG